MFSYRFGLPLTVFILAAALAAMPVCTPKRYHDEAGSLLSAMTLDQKIGQLLMPAVPGTSLNREAEELLARIQPGGLLLFGFNLTDRDGTRAFIADLQTSARRKGLPPLFISIDQEGGRVKRIVDGVTQFSGNYAAGIAADEELVFRWGRVLGLELRLMGVNMNLAPDLDVNNNPANPVINTRSFGPDPGLVSRLGVAYIRGLQESRCIAVGKHFPGHGDTNRDSHLTLPVIAYDRARLDRVEFVPFRSAVQSGVEGIMTAHIAYPAILGDNEPATLSRHFLTGILRTEMRFEGLVMTDDLEMHAIARRQRLGKAAVRSFLAGTDILLLSSWGSHVQEIVTSLKDAVADGTITMVRLDASVARIIEAKMRYGIMPSSGQDSVVAPFRLTEKDDAELRRTPAVNEEISRRGIYFMGDPRLLARGGAARRVLVTANPVLAEGAVGNLSVVPDIAALNAIAPEGAPGRETIVFVHVNEVHPDVVIAAIAACRARGFMPVVVCSGNPFPLSRVAGVTAALCSFSDTPESLRQLRRCLDGAFTPRSGRGLVPGLDGRAP